MAAIDVSVSKHLPPTLTVQYHFQLDAKFRPYVGAGVNYTRISSVDLKAPGVGYRFWAGDVAGLKEPRNVACISHSLNHSHSMVAGGLPEMSYTTRLMPRTSLMMRLLTLPSRVCGSSAQLAVMKSVVSTARRATTYS